MEFFSQPCPCLLFAAQHLTKTSAISTQERQWIKRTGHIGLVVQGDQRVFLLAQRYLSDRNQEKFFQAVTSFASENRVSEIYFEESYQPEQQVEGPEMTLDPC